MLTCPLEDSAAKFGFEPTSESVARLTAMIAKRQANMQEFADIAEKDADLTEHLLQAANPRATRKQDFGITTVVDAVQRVGMSYAILLAMTQPLTHAVYKTFHTMLELNLTRVAPSAVIPFTSEHVLGEVTFAGETTGLVHVRLPIPFVPVIGQRLLGLQSQEMADPAIANDIIGEMCNMVVGNFKSNLCDAGLNCKLSTPRISRTADFKLQRVAGGSSERHAFRTEGLEFFADLSVRPWA